MNKNIRIKLNILLISVAYFISYTCSIALLYSLLFYVNDKTNGDPFSWSIVRASFLLPGALTNIFIGILVDKYSKKKFMFFSELLSSLFIILFSYLFNLGFNNTFYISLYCMLLNITYSFFEIALDASMINITDEKVGAKLVSIIWFIRAISYILGPLVGEKFYTILNMKSIFYINSLFFLIASFLIYFIKFITTFESKTNKEFSLNFSSFKNQLLELKEYISNHQIVKFLFTLNISIALFYMPLYDSIIPNMSNYLGMKKYDLALIESASWLGVAICSLIIFAISNTSFFLKNLFTILKIQMLLLILWLFPLVLKDLDKNKILAIYAMLSIIDGALNSAQTLGILSYFQLQIPEEMRGQVLAVAKTAMRISAPIGTIIYGLLLKIIPWYVALASSILILIALSFYLGSNKDFKNFSNSIS